MVLLLGPSMLLPLELVWGIRTLRVLFPSRLEGDASAIRRACFLSGKESRSGFVLRLYPGTIPGAALAAVLTFTMIRYRKLTHCPPPTA